MFSQNLKLYRAVIRALLAIDFLTLLPGAIGLFNRSFGAYLLKLSESSGFEPVADLLPWLWFGSTALLVVLIAIVWIGTVSGGHNRTPAILDTVLTAAWLLVFGGVFLAVYLDVFMWV